MGYAALAERIRAARIGDLTPVDPPEPVVLDQLGGVLRSLRIRPQPGPPLRAAPSPPT